MWSYLHLLRFTTGRFCGVYYIAIRSCLVVVEVKLSDLLRRLETLDAEIIDRSYSYLIAYCLRCGRVRVLRNGGVGKLSEQETGLNKHEPRSSDTL